MAKFYFLMHGSNIYSVQSELFVQFYGGYFTNPYILFGNSWSLKPETLSIYAFEDLGILLKPLKDRFSQSVELWSCGDDLCF